MASSHEIREVNQGRRKIGLLIAGGLFSSMVLGQESYPSKPLKIIVPWGPGTPPDVAARIVANKLPEFIRQPVVVENRPGASGTLGLMELKRAPADGYTLVALNQATVTVESLYPQTRLSITKDFLGVGQLEWGHNILVVSPSLGLNNLQDLVGYIKSHPDASFASAGVGTPAHLSGLSLLKQIGASAAHIPYNQFSMAISDVSTGRVTFMVLAAPAAVPQIQGGKLKALAVTSPTRNQNLPDVPTVVEAGMPGMQSRTWTGLVVRSDTPEAIANRLSDAIASTMKLADVRENVVKQQAEVPGGSVDLFRELIAKDAEVGRMFVKNNGIKLD